jgi:predicted esterase YcpF (UPF0227 family)
MKVAFFHGLESAPRSFKNECLEEIFGVENVFAPAMDYRQPEIFDDVLNHLKHNPVDLLIGSSMGGWFAHKLSTLLNIPTLLFNPATNGRSFDPKVYTGRNLPTQHVIIGTQDEVIDPIENSLYFTEQNSERTRFIFYEKIGHRIPDDIFEKYVLMAKKVFLY